MHLTTFQLPGLDRLRIEAFARMGVSEPSRTVELVEPAALARILALLRSLPDEGEMMKSLAPCSGFLLTAWFQGRELGTLAIYGHRVKAPNTAFYVGGLPAEAELVRLVEGCRD